MTLKTINGFSAPSPDTIIWRYLSFARFEQLLKTKKLWLSRIDKFSDFNEGTLTHYMAGQIAGEFDEQGGTHFAGVLPFFHQFMNHKYWYASCWNCNPHESNLLWRSYASPGASDIYKFKVAIKTTVENLMNSLNQDDLYLCEVNYVDFDKDSVGDKNGIENGTLVYTKDLAYSDERELRLAYQNSDNMQGGLLSDLPETPVGTQVEVDIDVLIDSVYFEAIPIHWHKRVVSEDNPEALANLYVNGLEQRVNHRHDLVFETLRSHGVKKFTIEMSKAL